MNNNTASQNALRSKESDAGVVIGTHHRRFVVQSSEFATEVPRLVLVRSAAGGGGLRVYPQRVEVTVEGAVLTRELQLLLHRNLHKRYLHQNHVKGGGDSLL